MNILYVEDDPNSHKLVSLELQHSGANYKLTCAGSLAEARSLLTSDMPSGNGFDLVLMDMRLPDGTGLELMTEIRGRNLPVAIVILTGFGDEMTAVAAMKGGANEYLIKGKDRQPSLLPALESALARFRASQEQGNHPLRVLYAERNQADIDLTRRYLARYAPHIHLDIVYTGRKLLDKIADRKTAPLAWDVLLLDYRLPGYNALELLRILVNDMQLDVPVVLVTGQGDEGVAADALNLGAVDYLLKHSSYLNELPATLENASSRAKLAREQVALRHSEASARRKAEELAALLDISLAITTLDLDACLEEIGRRTKVLFNAHGCRIFLMEQNKSDLRCVLALDEYRTSLLGYSCPLGQGLTGHVAANGQAEIVDSVLGDPRALHPPGVSPIDQSMMLAPMQDRECLIGVITVSRPLSTEPFQSNDLDLLRALASLAAVTITNASLHAQTQNRLTNLETLYAVASDLRTAQDLDSALHDLLSRALTILETDSGSIWLHNAEEGILYSAASGGWFRSIDTVLLNPGEWISGTVFSTGHAYLSHEFRNDPLTHNKVRSQLPSGWGGVCLPIPADDEIVGVLSVAVELPRVVTTEQVSLLESMVEIAGSAIQRLRLWQQIQAQAQLVQQIVDTVPEGVFLIDSQGQVLLTNPAAKRFFALVGVAEETGVQRLGEHTLNEFLALATQGIHQELTVTERTFELAARPIDSSWEKGSWVLICHDVTEQHSRLRYEHAQERLATVGQLAAGIAHDFGNVLGAILLYAQAAEQTFELPPRLKRNLGIIQEQAKHAGDLIRQILDFSRQSMMERTPIDLLPFFKEHLKLLEHILPESIHLEFIYEEGTFVVNADPTRLRQVLMNLSLNARDAMPQGGSLRFAVSRLTVDQGTPPPLPDMDAGNWVVIAIADSGMGIDPEILPHIFTPFFTTKETGHGTGLGLAQVYGIVKQHRGSVDVASQPNQGSTFTIYLPLYSAAMQEMGAVTASLELERGTEQILLVEDNGAMLMALTDALEGLGYQVITAGNGVDALGIIEELGADSFGLVISDVVMPRMGGLELVRTLHQSHPTLRVLLITGHPLDTIDRELAGIDRVEWLQKPFEIGMLAEKARTLMG